MGYGAPRRPGVDIIGFPYRYNPMFGRSDAPSVIGTFDVDINYDQNCEDLIMGLLPVILTEKDSNTLVNKRNILGILTIR